MDTYTVITGATSGIGYELSVIFAKHGNNLVLIARNIEKLKCMKKEFEEKYDIKVCIISSDLSLKDSPEFIYKTIKDRGIIVDNLINNAGFGSFGRFQEVEDQKDLTMIDVNVRALTHMLKLFIPDMIKREKGKIMNVASTAAFQAGPLMSVYYATKAYVLSLSQALAVELKKYNITVSTLCPGPTSTEFQSRAEVKKAEIAKKSMMSAQAVAEEAYKGFMKGKEIIIPGVSNKFLVYSSKLLPRKFVHKIIMKVNKG